MKPLPLLVPASDALTVRALRDLRDDVHHRCGVLLAPVRVPSVGLLPLLLEELRDGLAWAPAWIASTLVRLRLATPLAATTRVDRRTRSAVLVTSRAVEGLADLAGRRVGWVSRFSATGYAVPRLYLESFGVDIPTLFREERFCGAHASAATALVRGEVDAIATHSGRLEDLFARTPIRVVATIGPVPADLVVAGVDVEPDVRAVVARALGALSFGAHAFSPVQDGHLRLFELLLRHARDLQEPVAPRSCESLATLP